MQLECMKCDQFVRLTPRVEGQTGREVVNISGLTGWHYTPEDGWRCPECGKPAPSETSPQIGNIIRRAVASADRFHKLMADAVELLDGPADPDPVAPAGEAVAELIAAAEALDDRLTSWVADGHSDAGWMLGVRPAQNRLRAAINQATKQEKG